MKSRAYRVVACANKDCRRLHRTSSARSNHLCAACQRAEHRAKVSDRTRGIVGYDGRASALNVRPVPVMSFGKCSGPCGRNDQELANGLCSECRFWAGPDTDAEMSERASKSSGIKYRNYSGM